MATEDDKKGGFGTRVFKKTSPNGKITTYLGKRDFVDHLTHVDVIDGMILVEDGAIENGQKVFATLVAAFRYGREDLDVLGLTFRKDLITYNMQVYPPLADETRPLTRLQERLRKKLGSNSHPFWFDVPPHSASSVTLQPAPGDTGKPCGVDYELKTYISDAPTDRPKKQGCVRLAIRKLTYAPNDSSKPQPSAEATKEFMMSPGLLHLEASLDKEMYYHGESIAVNVHIQNNSNKTVKKIRVAVAQIADICLFTSASYTCEVAKIESSEGFPVQPGGTLSKVYTLCPLLQNNREKRGLALDGKLKHEDTNLASSTILIDSIPKENLGIVVCYKVRIRLSCSGALGGELLSELPFTLSHAKPVESPDLPRKVTDTPAPIDTDLIDLIQMDTNLEGATMDDDIIFEDFARLRLKGASQDEAES